ncbi:TfoX/Sxy family protein [Kumtagia ephedrae]|jgi:DNA transformation protein|uniref:Competence protein TfoX n=1 Tax=Kumtagia ephedrae TaxID=2116701 RepID=A0A2P7S0B4_9HYPH|nr:TfoX/Sxy family protein [Mesorhizobium ephedrae]PSJ55894.1 competence protein TfoX [Mesorhizobium ephedrae]
MDNVAIADLFAGLGEVSIRRMFGGKGIYHNGLIIGIELRGELMLKGDEISAPELEAAGARRWRYTGSRHGKLVAMPYWTIPDEAVDDPEEFGRWARKAYEAAVRWQSKG